MTGNALASDGGLPAPRDGGVALATTERQRRLAMPHFAHLRGVAQGLNLVTSAKHFLAAATIDEAREAHEEVLSAARALATRLSEVEGKDMVLRKADLPLLFEPTEPAAMSTLATVAEPEDFDQALRRWADAKGLDVDEWDRDDLIASYEAEQPELTAAAVEPATTAPESLGQADVAETQQERMMRQLAALHTLEKLVAVSAEGSHLIGEWFDTLTTGRLLRAGMLRLDELQQRIAGDARWYRNVVAIGAGKAAAIEAYVELLLPPVPKVLPGPPPTFAVVDALIGVADEPATGMPAHRPTLPTHSLIAPAPAGADPAARQMAQLDVPVPAEIRAAAEAAMPAKLRASLAAAGLDGRAGLLRMPYCTGRLRARDDLEAIVSWVRAKAGSADADNYSPTTARAYLQHALRLMLWCVSVRGIALSSMQSEDCEAYMAWLANIPEEWIGRGRAQRWESGWRPFSSQLTRASRQHAVRLASALSAWLHKRGYIGAHPWAEIKLKLGDDPGPRRRSRAFTAEAWAAIIDYVEQPLVLGEQVSPARRAELEADRQRMLFVLKFNEATGLRGTELATTVLGHFTYAGGSRWKLAVHGKGQVTAEVWLSPQALRALQRYLEFRGLPPLGEAPGEVPLLTRVDAPKKPIGYRALAESFRVWVRRAMDASTLPAPERDLALQATTHWLRHTMATTADERGVSRSSLRQQLRHRDSRTTDGYVHPRVERVQVEFEEAFR